MRTGRCFVLSKQRPQLQGLVGGDAVHPQADQILSLWARATQSGCSRNTE